MGSYVYGSEDKHLTVGGGDVRGMKEGRKVGADSPRKVGLGGGLGGERMDQGWRSVKRVAVVGVHGW